MANVLKIWDEASQQYVGIPSIKGRPGDNGKDALTINTTVSVLVEPTIGESIGSDLEQFNRTPEVGDVFLLLYNGGEAVAGRSWLCTCSVTAVTTQTVFSAVSGIMETTGATGITAESIHAAYVGATDAQKQTARDDIGAIASPSFTIVTQAYAASVEVAANALTNIATLTANIAITISTGLTGYDNEWAFTVTQGATAYDVVLPTIEWYSDAPTFEANSVTECRLFYVGSTLCGVAVSVS